MVAEVKSVTARFPRSAGASDVGLLVEIADTSLAEDRKMPQTYAARGITFYWIVNLVDRQLDPRLPMSWTLRANPGDTGPLWHRPRTDQRLRPHLHFPFRVRTARGSRSIKQFAAPD